MKVICISGKAQSGKDTAASLIRDILYGYGQRVLITHYADLLKFMCEKFFHWNGVKDEHGRQILQYVGTDVVRKQKPDFWVDFIASVLELFPDEWDYVLIPDTRFPNEITNLKNAGYSVCHLHITRPGMSDGLTAAQHNHVSEHALDGVEADYSVANTGNTADFATELMKFLNDCGLLPEDTEEE